jgi:uncharacterized protein DUF5666/uncharacterized protein DUF4382
MQASKAGIAKGIGAAMGAVLITAAIIVAGCTASNNLTGSGTTITSATTPVPVSITDAPGDQVVAASLTLNSVVLTDQKNQTSSILSAPLTFEAAHLDAVQELLFTPAIPQDTYTSVTVTYSNAQVAYIDPTTKQLVLDNATLANTSQVFTFPTPLVVNNTTTSLIIDFLVANSVSISGSTATVTPQFHIAPAPIAATPTNGANGLMTGIRGKVSALGTNQFTLTNPEGLSLVIDVNSGTQYQGLSGFSALAVGALVEVDVAVQGNATLLALRVEEQVPPNATAELLIGPVTAVTGSPATSFTQIVRQQIGPAPTTTPIQKDTITVNSQTQWVLPGLWQNLLAAGLPFKPTFNASTLFAGQVVAVQTGGVSNNAATAQAVFLAPQTVSGTITGGVMPTCIPCWGQLTLTLPADSWLATVTGQTTVNVIVPTAGLQALPGATAATSSVVRFNGFLFNSNGVLTLVPVVEGPPPGTPIGPTI